MSRANVEIAKRFVDAGNRGDVEAALEFLAEDFVLTWTEPPPGQPPVIHGRDEFAGFWAEWAQFFEGFTRQIEEWIDAGDWVISAGTWVGTGKESGARVEGHSASAARFHEGQLVAWIIGFPNKDAALGAAGLTE